MLGANFRELQKNAGYSVVFFSVDYYDFTISVLNLNRMRTEII